jgi:hypothetical protein
MDPNNLKEMTVYYYAKRRQHVCFLSKGDDGCFLFVPVNFLTKAICGSLFEISAGEIEKYIVI